MQQLNVQQQAEAQQAQQQPQMSMPAPAPAQPQMDMGMGMPAPAQPQMNMGMPAPPPAHELTAAQCADMGMGMPAQQAAPGPLVEDTLDPFAAPAAQQKPAEPELDPFAAPAPAANLDFGAPVIESVPEPVVQQPVAQPEQPAGNHQSQACSCSFLSFSLACKVTVSLYLQSVSAIQKVSVCIECLCHG